MSNEVGLGVMPPTELGRTCVEELARVNHIMAAGADGRVLTVVGLYVDVKGSG